MLVKVRLVEEAPSHATLAVDGRLDMEGSWDFERDLMGYLSGDMRHLLIDMSAVDFLGSMGIRVFVRSASALMRKQKKLVLFAAQSSVAKVLSVTGFTSAIPLVPRLNDAKAAIGV